MRMTDIVLAVSKCALTVLPGFAPVDRREAHEEGAVGGRREELTPRLRVEDRPPRGVGDGAEDVGVGQGAVHDNG